MQQHFGPEMDARHLPGDWQSTDNALECMLHQSKDVVTVVDEYKPPDNARGRALYQQRAERIFRGVGNHSGRRRMRADLSLAPSHPPRGLLLSTGEEQPSGQSLAARRIDVDLRPGDVDMDRLSECQRRARDGGYAQAMAGYVRYRAGQIDDRAPAAADFDALRHEAVEAQAHPRTASNLAELGLGWASFLAFADEVGAITVERRAQLWGDLWRELMMTWRDIAMMTLRAAGWRPLPRAAPGCGYASTCTPFGSI